MNQRIFKFSTTGLEAYFLALDGENRTVGLLVPDDLTKADVERVTRFMETLVVSDSAEPLPELLTDTLKRLPDLACACAILQREFEVDRTVEKEHCGGEPWQSCLSYVFNTLNYSMQRDAFLGYVIAELEGLAADATRKLSRNWNSDQQQAAWNKFIVSALKVLPESKWSAPEARLIQAEVETNADHALGVVRDYLKDLRP